MKLSSLFAWTPAVKRARSEQADSRAALAEKIDSEMQLKHAKTIHLNVQETATKVREVNRQNHFSPKLEALYSKGKPT